MSLIFNYCNNCKKLCKNNEKRGYKMKCPLDDNILINSCCNKGHKWVITYQKNLENKVIHIIYNLKRSN